MRYTIEELDCMEGHKFEYAVADLLCHNGWRDVDVTSGSGDYGVDVIARRGNVLYAIQCKRWNNSVGVAAVRDAAAGMDYWHCSAAAVIATHGYTKQAENMAKNIGVRLWDRDFLLELIENYSDEYEEYDPQIMKWGTLVKDALSKTNDNTNKTRKSQSKTTNKKAVNKKGKENNKKKEHGKGIELSKQIYVVGEQLYLGDKKISYKGLKVLRFFILLLACLMILIGFVAITTIPFESWIMICWGVCLLLCSINIKKAISKYNELKSKKKP